MRFLPLIAFFATSLVVFSAAPPPAKVAPPTVHGASEEGEAALKRFKLAPGLQGELFAAEPMLANPVAIDVDNQGRVFVSETFRLHAGVTDIRGHMNWLDDDLASRSVEGLENIFKKYLGEKTRDLTNYSERVSLVIDSNDDGKADKATVFASGFNSMVDGIASGVLANKGEVYFANIPHLWLLQDRNNDGISDARKSLQYGYGVRVGFLGHDLHGLTIGPDGKLYFSIGDRGFSVKQPKGPPVEAPEMGAVLRCNLNGTGLEIFAYGLRNPQELAFDDYGNLFTGDNNSDGGDQARWVYLVEGGDSGWRVGYQHVSSPVARGPWNAEKMWHPQWKGQPAHLIPPLANIGNGPSGLIYYNGFSLPEQFRGKFLLCDFKGSSGNSIVHAIGVQPKGAGFEVTSRTDLISSILCTDIAMAPDGSVMISDWVEGWAMPGKGRIYRFYEQAGRTSELSQATAKLLSESFERKAPSELALLLQHPDRRIRQEAQFALASKKASTALIAVATRSNNQLARIHALWGLGQIGDASALGNLAPLARDSDPEIRAQFARVLGDARAENGYGHLLRMMDDPAPRARFFAAMGLAKFGRKENFRPALELLRQNKDEDVYLRHAGVMALASTKDIRLLAAASNEPDSSARLGALLALRRLHSGEVKRFLNDADPFIVDEAARAIYDETIDDAMPSLAGALKVASNSEPFWRRAVQANYREGRLTNAVNLRQIAINKSVPEVARAEAVRMLGDWETAQGRDPINSLWRPLAKKSAPDAVMALRAVMSELLTDAPSQVRTQAVRATGKLKISEAAPILSAIIEKGEGSPNVRVEALRSLSTLGGAGLQKSIEAGLKDSAETVRNEARAIQARLNPSDAFAGLKRVLENGSITEKQRALASLASIREKRAEALLEEWLDKVVNKTVPSELMLDVLESAARVESKQIKAKLASFEQSREKSPPLEKYKESLAGGDALQGRAIFFERAEASCLRCHKIGNEGGEVGPHLDGIASKKDREYLLSSIVDPNRDIAAGYENVVIRVKSGTTYMGQLKEENGSKIIINSPEDGIVEISKSEVESRDRGLSSMPAEMAVLLTKREIRDVVEYLTTLK